MIINLSNLFCFQSCLVGCLLIFFSYRRGIWTDANWIGVDCWRALNGQRSRPSLLLPDALFQFLRPCLSLAGGGGGGVVNLHRFLLREREKKMKWNENEGRIRAQKNSIGRRSFDRYVESIQSIPISSMESDGIRWNPMRLGQIQAAQCWIQSQPMPLKDT